MDHFSVTFIQEFILKKKKVKSSTFNSYTLAKFTE